MLVSRKKLFISTLMKIYGWTIFFDIIVIRQSLLRADYSIIARDKIIGTFYIRHKTNLSYGFER